MSTTGLFSAISLVGVAAVVEDCGAAVVVDGSSGDVMVLMTFWRDLNLFEACMAKLFCKDFRRFGGRFGLLFRGGGPGL